MPADKRSESPLSEPIALGDPPYNPAQVKDAARSAGDGTYPIVVRLNRLLDVMELIDLKRVLQLRYSSFALTDSEVIIAEPHLIRLSAITFNGGDTKSFQEHVAPTLRAAIKDYSDRVIADEQKVLDEKTRLAAEEVRAAAEAEAAVTEIHFD